MKLNDQKGKAGPPKKVKLNIAELDKLSVSERLELILQDKENIYLVNDFLKENGFEISEIEMKKFIEN